MQIELKLNFCSFLSNCHKNDKFIIQTYKNNDNSNVKMVKKYLKCRNVEINVTLELFLTNSVCNMTFNEAIYHITDRKSMMGVYISPSTWLDCL